MSPRAGRSRLTLALLVITSLVILTLDFRDTAVVERARDVAGGALAPVQRGAEAVFSPVGNVWNGITGYGDLEAENAALRDRIAELEGAAALDEGAAEQLAALLESLDIPWVGDIERVSARVVAGPASNFVHTVDIDKGTDHGVREGMPVVTGSGLLGRVVRATATRATVQTVADPDFRVGIRLSETGTLGTARGTGSARRMLADVPIRAEDDVPEDQLVTTSGADQSLFPGDIPVGHVRGSEPASTGINLDLVIRPLAEVDRLSYLTVLQWEPQQ